MKFTIYIKNLNCSNCAAKIEAAVNNLPYVKSAALDFSSLKLHLECDDAINKNDILKAVEDITASIEKGVTYSLFEFVPDEEDEESNHDFMSYLGAVLFIAALFTDHIYKAFSISSILYILSYLFIGAQVIIEAGKKIFSKQLFNENLLMTVATVGALIIGEYPEAVAVMLFYRIGEYFQDKAVGKSRKSIKALMDLKPDFATVLREENPVTVPPEEVLPGEIILVKPGERVPIDGIIESGYTALDASAITGESVPINAAPGDEVLSGCINQSSLIKLKTTKAFGESTVSRIMELVEGAGHSKAKTEQFITRFAAIYTPIVVLLALVVALVPPIFLGGLSEWIHRGLVFLVISCPCALVLSVPLGFFGGIGAASKAGILVKSSNSLESLTKLEAIAFDKTGTLTEGKFNVCSVIPARGFSEDDLITLAATAEHSSNHPIAKSIVEYSKIEASKDADFNELPGKGMSGTIEGAKILVGNSKLMEEENISYSPYSGPESAVYVAKNGEFVGSIAVEDTIKPNTKSAISKLKDIGIKTYMLTGDKKQIAEKVASALNLDGYYGELMPEDKIKYMHEIKNNLKGNNNAAFAGDGINDAPVLAAADISIAMGSLGSDAAIEASDIVLMKDDIKGIVNAIKIARKTSRIVKQNIVVALSFKAIIMVLALIGFDSMWLAVFADVGVALIAVLNSMRTLNNSCNLE